MRHYRKAVSLADGLPLDILEIIPDGEIKGIVQIVHGMQEHKERYLHFMEFLASHGYACIAHDHRGHGESVYKKEDLGYFYDQKAEAIVDDINDVIKDLLLRYPHVPVFLFGHSMGSLVVRKYLKKYDDRINGLIISGAVFNNPGVKAGLMLVKVLSKMGSDRNISTLVEKMSNGSFDKGIPGDTKNRWLSVNPENVKAFNEDEKSGFPFTLNGYQNLFALIKDVYDTKGWAMRHKELPILFVAGREDPVIGSPAEYEKSVQYLKDRGYKNVTSKLYNHMRHEILNETNRQVVYDDILAFIKEYSC